MNTEKVVKDLERLQSATAREGIRWAYPPEGVLRVRFIPDPFNQDGTFYFLVFNHRVPSTNSQTGWATTICSKHTFGEECAACAIYERLKGSGLPIEQELARQLSPYPRLYTNAIIRGWRRSVSDQTLMTVPNMEYTLDYLAAHPVLLVLPYTVAKALLNMYLQFDFSSPQEGFDIEIVRTTIGNRTEYTVQPIPQPYPLQNYSEIVENAYNLEEIARSRQVPFQEMYENMLMDMTQSGSLTPTVQAMVAETFSSKPHMMPSQQTPQAQGLPSAPQKSSVGVEPSVPVQQVVQPQPQSPTPAQQGTQSVTVPPNVQQPTPQQPTPQPSAPQPEQQPQQNATTASDQNPSPQPSEQQPSLSDDVMKRLEELKKRFGGGE